MDSLQPVSGRMNFRLCLFKHSMFKVDSDVLTLTVAFLCRFHFPGCRCNFQSFCACTNYNRADSDIRLVKEESRNI